MQKVRFDVKANPTKKTPGVALVLNHVYNDPKDLTAGYEETVMGAVTTPWGSKQVDAEVFVANGVQFVGSFQTRSQAGHAIQRAFLKGMDAVAKKADTTQLMTRKEAAAHYNVSVRTIGRWLEKGKLVADNDGKIVVSD